jgi:photosystem II CP43 chlorophyll apoprotein
MEDIVGGHVYLAVIEIIGGLFHVLTKPYGWSNIFQ